MGVWQTTKDWCSEQQKAIRQGTYRPGDDQFSIKALAEILKALGAVFLACSEGVVKAFEAFSLPKTHPLIHLLVFVIVVLALGYMVIAHEKTGTTYVFSYPRFGRWAAIVLAPASLVLGLGYAGVLVFGWLFPPPLPHVSEPDKKNYLAAAAWVADPKTASSEASRRYRVVLDAPSGWTKDYHELSVHLLPSVGFKLANVDVRKTGPMVYEPKEEPTRRDLDARGSVEFRFPHFQSDRKWQIVVTVDKVDAAAKFGAFAPVDVPLFYHK